MRQEGEELLGCAADHGLECHHALPYRAEGAHQHGIMPIPDPLTLSILQHPQPFTIGFVAIHGLDGEQEVLVLEVLDVSQNWLELRNAEVI